MIREHNGEYSSSGEEGEDGEKMDYFSEIQKVPKDRMIHAGDALLQSGRASSLNNISLNLLNHFKETGHLEDLDTSIQLNRDALEHCPVGHPHRGFPLNSLSEGLTNRFEQTGHLRDLEESIQLNRDALLLHPMGHPLRGSSLNNLGASLSNRFEQTGHLEDLEESIQLNRDALELFPVGHPRRGFSLNSLGESLTNRFEQTGHLRDLEESIQLIRDALLLHPMGHPLRGSSLNNLGASLSNRFEQTGHLEDLEESIQLNRDALELFPVGHPRRGFSLNSLGESLLCCFLETGHIGELEESIQLNRDALVLHPVGHTRRGFSLGSLSEGLQIRFQETGHLGDLHESIQLSQDALLLHPLGSSFRGSLLRNLGHQLRGYSLNSLALALQDRFQQTSHLEDLDESIQLNQDALLLFPKGRPDRGLSLNNLGMGLWKRFQQTGHLGDLNESIQLNRDVLLLHPVGHQFHGISLNNLSLGLQNRFQQTGHLEDLDEAIKLNRDALLLHPVGHQVRGFLLSNLSVGLQNRFEQTGHLEDLDESIQLNQDVLLLYPVGHEFHGLSVNNLSMGLWKRFQQTGYLGDLDECIQLNRDALLLHPVGHQLRGLSLNNLSMGLWKRFSQTDQLQDLEDSINLNRDALLLHPVGHPRRGFSLNSLGVGLRDRFQQTGHLGDLDDSIQLNRDALLLHPVGHHLRGVSLNNLGSCLKSRFQRTGYLGDLDECIQLSRDVLLLYPVGHPLHGRSLSNLSVDLYYHFKHTTHQEDLMECVSTSQQAAEDTYSPVPDCLAAVLNWYQHLLSVISLPEFVSDGASQAIQLGQLTLAVEMIEQGRGLLWSELRGLRPPMYRLQALDPSLVDELKQINHRLEMLSMQNSVDQSIGLYIQTDSPQHQMEVTRDQFGHSLSEKRHLLHAQRDIIEKIHKIPGFETFLGRKSSDELKPAASHGPVIVVNCSRYRSDILILLEQNSPVLIPLVEGFYEQVQNLVEQLTEASSIIKAAPKRYNHVLRATLKDLWDLLVSPVVTKLRELHIPEKSRIFWCPTSILSTLPLHAAGPISPGTKEFLPDLYISSYTPTLTALIDAFNATNSFLQLPSLLVAGQYDGSLQNTKDEVNEVAQYKKCITVTSLEEASATKNAVAKALVDHDWLHIASHGTLVPKEPFSSYFSLAEGSHFTLLDIIRLNLPNATFAFLSACHTAEQSQGSVHNEVLHLAAAMQFSGFRSVVGTMWEMADIDGPEVAKDFYSYLFSDENLAQCNEIGAQARALSEAIQKMRGRKGVTLERLRTPPFSSGRYPVVHCNICGLGWVWVGWVMVSQNPDPDPPSRVGSGLGPDLGRI
ncbi:CHAT domain-containing protein [Rhodocollybia butyracea]|uniref:CHAT domain-containing protein n=1 Tax=Rhodocollybia butyracea TaxID=206335 RepID=A0A9P5PU52_9AGAR|nr:CHAT domain-containing protein [Rhodocollybia butyracea]